MVFMISIMTLELSTSIKIDPKTFNQRYVVLFSRFMFFMVSILFLNKCLSVVIYLESL